MKVIKKLNQITNEYNNLVACDIIEKHTLYYIENYIKGDNDGKDLIVILGNLAFLYRKKEIQNKRIVEFIKKIFNICHYINEYLAKRISNFMEIILNKNKELIEFYIKEIENFKGRIDRDCVAILYKASILPSFKNKLPVDKLVEKFKYPWRSYYEISLYHYYYNDNINSLKYIFKALNTCPKKLINEYNSRKQYLKSKLIKIKQKQQTKIFDLM
ncbi:hypothetical protein [Clostridium brassicae]|uniref:Uncharacterized protein n=1 Tax=Clostridium brassicae TaxID=2999072 RepID=A0ABT4DAB4_9CLOT|nr:hypothetical protein [Clostridium brassicae]MCY6959123.1 hypothetical protein [Clostridium brassicae]